MRYFVRTCAPWRGFGNVSASEIDHVAILDPSHECATHADFKILLPIREASVHRLCCRGSVSAVQLMTNLNHNQTKN